MKKPMICTIRDVQAILKLLIKAIFSGEQNAATIPASMLWGPPGIGKSSIIRQLCEELKVHFIDIRLAQRDPVDLRGVPEIVNGQTVFRIPAELPRDGKGIILFDEISACDPSVQVAAYELILDRRLGQDYQVPPGYYIVAAGNRREDKSVSRPMSAALSNRFMHLELEPDVKSVLDYFKIKKESK